MEFTFELNEIIQTDLKNVIPFVEKVSKKILELTSMKEETFRIKLVLEEAITNAMRHGNHLDARKNVKIKILANEFRILAEVTDEGEGFDFLNVADPTIKENSTRPGGRGVYLMREIMDEVKFYDGGRTVTMVKNFCKNDKNKKI